MFQNKLKNNLLLTLEKLEFGTLKVTLPDGMVYQFEGRKKGEIADIDIQDWSVLTKMLIKGDIGLAESYRDGLWSTENLSALMILSLQNSSSFESIIRGHKLPALLAKLSYVLKLNTLNGSKKNIHQHYDLGNDFYKLWLDPSMTYSSGLYNNANDSLQHAQEQKYNRIIERMGSNSGRVLEVGCGWGGFADRAMDAGDYDIKGITLSSAQHDYARDRMKGRADIVLEDYRAQTGKFDSIVSIEMFEAVGEGFWPTYFSQLKNLLNSKGKAVIQTITMNEKDFPRYRKTGDFIRTYIFPGGMLPSPSRFQSEAERAGLKIQNSFSFGQDYAYTLSAWLENFDAKYDDIKNMGFDDGFIRLWRLYLAACMAGFKTERTDVMQVELLHA